MKLTVGISIYHDHTSKLAHAELSDLLLAIYTIAVTKDAALYYTIDTLV